MNKRPFLLSLLFPLLSLRLRPGCHAHNEDTWDSPDSEVLVSLNDDEGTQLRIQLNEFMCTKDDAAMACTIDLDDYASPSCPLYNNSVVVGDTNYDCKSAHRGRVELDIRNKFGCVKNPYVNITYALVNGTRIRDALATATSVAGHACIIQSIENVKIDGVSIMEYRWERSSPSAKSMAKKTIMTILVGIVAAGHLFL